MNHLEAPHEGVEATFMVLAIGDDGFSSGSLVNTQSDKRCVFVTYF
jgi:hypothetical protein